MNDWLTRLMTVSTEWQPLETAPADGTPILIAQGDLIGIYAYIDDGDTNALGKQMGRCWHGVHILSEFTPMTKGGKPTGDKILHMLGVDDDATWMPLPAPPDQNENGT